MTTIPARYRAPENIVPSYVSYPFTDQALTQWLTAAIAAPVDCAHMEPLKAPSALRVLPDTAVSDIVVLLNQRAEVTEGISNAEILDVVEPLLYARGHVLVPLGRDAHPAWCRLSECIINDANSPLDAAYVHYRTYKVGSIHMLALAEVQRGADTVETVIVVDWWLDGIPASLTSDFARVLQSAADDVEESNQSQRRSCSHG